MKKILTMTVFFLASTVSQAKDSNFIIDAKDTALNGLFASLVGTDNYWPKLAITTLQSPGNNCVIAKATIWHSESRKEVIPSFKVCNTKEIGGAKLAKSNGLFDMQMDVMNNTGYQRTEGPIAPSSSSTGTYNGGILHELMQITGWHEGQVDTNFWLVNDMK